MHHTPSYQAVVLSRHTTYVRCWSMHAITCVVVGTCAVEDTPKFGLELGNKLCALLALARVVLSPLTFGWETGSKICALLTLALARVVLSPLTGAACPTRRETQQSLWRTLKVDPTIQNCSMAINQRDVLFFGTSGSRFSWGNLMWVQKIDKGLFGEAWTKRSVL